MSDTQTDVRPERLAAASRALQPVLLERLALHADRIARGLARDLRIVPWERIHLIGLAQLRLQNLREERFGRPGGPPVRLVERRAQPLESLDLSWRFLRQGRPVHVEFEEDACPEVVALVQEIAELLGQEVLSVGEPGGELPAAVCAWSLEGVVPARERIGLVQRDGDREVAAYVLARACLRRTGYDPRAIHRILVVGPSERFERDLRRLFVGARMGAEDDAQAFAGPVPAEAAEIFVQTERAWRTHAEVETLCEGGRLIGDDDDDVVCLAPALVKARWQATADLPPPCGPLLVIHPVSDEEAESVLESLAPDPVGRVRVGEPPRGLVPRPDDRLIRGALLVERLPPGLPDPRP